MPLRYAHFYSTRTTPQSEPIPGSRQVPNSAGGHAYAVDDWTRLDRFLTLGSEGGSYYASAERLTIQNAEAVRRCVAADGIRAVNRIADFSEAGRVPKNDPAVFALALALALASGMGDGPTRAAALAAVPLVCRTGTHLFAFVEATEGFRGWGRGLKRAVGAWYARQEPQALVYQLAKYQRRAGWSHRDLLRLCHVRLDGASAAAARWAVGKGGVSGLNEVDESDPLTLLSAVEAVTFAVRLPRW